MNSSGTEKNSIKNLKIARRKGLDRSQEELIVAEALGPEKNLPLVIRPAVDGVDLLVWTANNREFIERELATHGGILFRKFDIASAPRFEQFAMTISGEAMEYRERSSPRSQVSGNIYTSTDYPAEQSIFLHNENSYSHVWPMKVFFFCLAQAREGGETLIADCRRILNRIDPKIRDRFMEKKVMYVRNFGDRLGLSWQSVFRSSDRKAVEEYCRNSSIHFEWKDHDRLRTRQVRPALLSHPKTGEAIWFNHATFFHISTLESEMRETLMAEFGQEDLPNNTYYGDGSPIEPSVMDHLRHAYLDEAIPIPWKESDILLLDNMLSAHGRAPFKGARRLLVAMTEPSVSAA